MSESSGLLSALYQEAQEMAEKKGNLLSELSAVDIRYLGEEALAHGGMKNILSVTDQTTGRPVAMAVLRDTRNLEQVENFLREARITAHLEHPNIVPVYDIGLNEENQPFFTMKLLQGENLGTVLKQRRSKDSVYGDLFPRGQLLDIFVKICEAIAFAHSEGILHLDLKPQNIQVSDFGQVLVCDWGLASIVGNNGEKEVFSVMDDEALYRSYVSSMTLHGEIKGTPGYMSPEQASSGTKDHRTDIYALGGILYSLLTFECPVGGVNFEEIRQATVDGDVIAPRRRRPDRKIPESLEAIVMKAMALDPGDRYQSVDDLLTDVQSVRNGYASMAEEAGFAKRITLFIKRNPRVFILLGLCLVTFSTIVVFFTQQLKTREAEAQQSATEAAAAQEAFTQLELASQKYFDALGAFDKGKLTKAMKHTEEALGLHPEHERARELKGHLLFAQHDIEGALDVYETSETVGAKVWAKNVRRLTEFPKNEEAVVEPESILALMNRVDWVLRGTPTMRYFRDHALRSKMSLEKRMALVEGLLKRDNAYLEEVKMEWEQKPDGRLIVNLSGQGLRNIRALSGAPITHLNLANNDLTGIQGLEGMPLRDLKLGGNHYLQTIKQLAPGPGQGKGTKTLRLLDLSRTQPFSSRDTRGLKIARLLLIKSGAEGQQILNFLKDCSVDEVVMDKSPKAKRILRAVNRDPKIKTKVRIRQNSRNSE